MKVQEIRLDGLGLMKMVQAFECGGGLGFGFHSLVDILTLAAFRPIEVGRAKADGPCQADSGGGFAASIVEDLLLEFMLLCLLLQDEGKVKYNYYI